MGLGLGLFGVKTQRVTALIVLLGVSTASTLACSPNYGYGLGDTWGFRVWGLGSGPRFDWVEGWSKCAYEMHLSHLTPASPALLLSQASLAPTF